MYIILVDILLYDILYYLMHIFLHKNIYFVHKLHHLKLSNTLTYLDSYTGDVIEKPIEIVCILIPYYVTKPGLPFFLLLCFIIILRNLMKHDTRCSWLVGNHHLLHHKYPKYNFGEYWIDKLCGTKCPKEKEYIYGII